MSLSQETAIRLIEECKFMLSRVNAILECENALQSLTAEDVFGCNYAQALCGDKDSLAEAIQKGESELKTIAKLPE